MIRTFIAVELDPALKHILAGVQDSLKRELRRLAPDARLQWVRTDSIHLTLKFLGNIEESQVAGILQVLEPVGRDQRPFSVDVKGFGVFPHVRGPRVLWMGFTGEIDRLVRLAGSIDTALASLGFSVEEKPYTPHLTLARVKEQSGAIGKALTESGIMREITGIGTCPVQAVALMKSEPSPAGSLYTRLGTIPLAWHEV